MVYVDSEVYEAIDAATEALDRLHEARDTLSSARNWGLFDMVGGGLLATVVKRKKMLAAQKQMDAARQALENFKDELDDVFDLDLKMDDFVSFADLFLDNFFFGDIVVQGRISEALNKTDRVIKAVERIRKQLQDILNS
ncbi:MAG: hypothetical protein IKX97_06200 [Erysipelotrichaceae bacterium]|nr:hypothetical protein [Erysipelotrichaceae bacterium]